jgi:hypothetical protein
MFRSFDYDYDDLSRLTAISQGSTRLDSFIYDTNGLLLRRNGFDGLRAGFRASVPELP